MAANEAVSGKDIISCFYNKSFITGEVLEIIPFAPNFHSAGIFLKWLTEYVCPLLAAFSSVS